MIIDREQGYYWVKTESGVWHVAHWYKNLGEFYWKVCWSKFQMYDEDFTEINENRIIHEEKEC